MQTQLEREIRGPILRAAEEDPGLTEEEVGPSEWLGRRQAPSPEAQGQRFPEVRETESLAQMSPICNRKASIFPPLMGDPANPRDTLFLFVFPLPSQQAD